MNSFTASCRDIFFPAHCLGCNQQLNDSRLPLLCPQCLSDVAPVVSPHCTCCGTPFPSGTDHLCGICLRSGFGFDYGRSIFYYREPISLLLLRFKFSGKLTGLATIAALADQAGLHNLFQEPDLILPVPLHISRLRSRGFNQALLLARSCFPQWQDKIHSDLLHRHRPTIPQTSLSGKARRNNLKGAFSVSNPGQVAGKTILLIDDVFTTGSTLHECAKILSRAGVTGIEAFTLAMALRE